MKNVVVFVIDSLSFETLENYPSDDLFLKKEIFKNCVSFNNVYTDGAFTEAAIKSLYCGESALENCSYLYGNKYRKNSIFKTYKDKGYFVHFGSCELYPFSNSILEDCNDYDYNCWPSINNTGFNCRLDFFDEKDVFINELITNAYIETLDFFNDLNSKINHTKTYKNRYKEDTKLFVYNLNEEYVKYTKNEYSFQKSTSLLFKNPYPVFKFSDSFVQKNTNKLSSVKEKADYLYRKNLSKVKKNNLFFLLDVFRNKKDTLKRILKYLDYKGTFLRILHKEWYPYNSVLTFNRYNSKKMASARSIINQTLSKIENKNVKK